MNKTEDEVVRLTAECLTRYWKRDSTFIFSHCAPKIVSGSVHDRMNIF